MENTKYSTLHGYPKITNQDTLACAVQGTQKIFNGHAIFNSNEQFKVIQVRKGHLRTNDLTYVLMWQITSLIRTSPESFNGSLLMMYF